MHESNQSWQWSPDKSSPLLNTNTGMCTPKLRQWPSLRWNVCVYIVQSGFFKNKVSLFHGRLTGFCPRGSTWKRLSSGKLVPKSLEILYLQLNVTVYGWFPRPPDSFTLWWKLVLPLDRSGVHCTALVGGGGGGGGEPTAGWLKLQKGNFWRGQLSLCWLALVKSIENHASECLGWGPSHFRTGEYERKRERNCKYYFLSPPVSHHMS